MTDSSVIPDTDLHFLDVTAPTFSFLGPDFRAARERDWYAWSPAGLVVTRYAEANALMRHRNVVFDGQQQLTRNGVTAGPLHDWWSTAMFTAEPARHARLRGLLARSFNARFIEGLRPFAHDTAAELVAELAAGAGHPVDFTARFADRYPALLISQVLGVPRADYDLFSRWIKDFSLSLAPNLAEVLPRVDRAVSGLSEYVAGLVERRRHDRGDDLISALLATVEAGDQLTAEELHSLVMILVWGGIDSAAHQIGQLLVCFLDGPDQWDLLARQPELVSQAVEEACRFRTAAFAAPMFADADIDYQDVHIPAGTFVLIPFGGVNRDPRAFPDPDRFDVTAARAHPPMLFGGGAHYCLGAALAKIELAATLGALTRRFTPPVLAGEIRWTHPFAPIQGPDELPVRFTLR
ncbi:MAG TPA: cytochrome P450 [Jatrophihabitans sp.]|nr:cytochrome P450 [Jatrophihabitans sp.]